MLEPNEPLVSAVAEFSREMVRQGSEPEKVISALLDGAHILAEREGADDFLRDLLEVSAKKLEKL